MNREQQRYFIKRIEEIKNVKIFALRGAENKEVEELEPSNERLRKYVKKHEKAVKETMYAFLCKFLDEGKGRCVEFYTEPVTPWSNRTTLPGVAECVEAFMKAEEKITEKYRKERARIEGEAKRLIDEAMFCQLPDELATKLAAFEKF